MNEKSLPQGFLVYDSQCNLCLVTKAWFEKRDSSGKVGFVSAHDPGLSIEFPQLQGLDLLGEITWIDQRGQLYRGADAIANALQHIPGWRWTASLMMLPGTKTFRHAAYRWIAKNRYQWFGRTCDSGTCTLRSEPVAEHSAPAWPICFSLLVLVLVTSPILQNFRADGKARDDFPLSYYPMFSSKRQNLYQQSSVMAIKQNGETVPVHYEMLGTGGLNQIRRQLGKLLSVERTEELRQHLSQVADRLAASNKSSYRGCVSVAAVKGTYDLNAYFTRQNQQPVDMEVILEVGLPVGHEKLSDTQQISN
jgi:predicted DCC family thiol-disulfide oxidoreductase YuxK